MIRTLITLPLLTIPLSGCLLVDYNTRSGFFTGGTLNDTAVVTDDVQQFGDVYSDEIGGVSYYTTLGNGRAEAYAGIASGSNVGPELVSGTAVYLADYEIASISNLRYYENELYGVSSLDGGTILLTADLSTMTLTGARGGFEVDGTISGGTVGGNVTYGGLQGDLRGLVGQQGVIGAFHANNGEMVYSGGFMDYVGD
ncbi:MAG: hypothetical protein VX874_18290 [Pseudomonadota bacterium]|nr:hypothetical protein [Pseudomonadota bacterium]